MADTTRVEQIENYGHPEVHSLPPGTGNCFIWRLHSIARYEERDGGVYLELEAIALSRDIPPALRGLVKPVVNHLSINSVTATLRQTREAVGSTRTPKLLASCPRIDGHRQFDYIGRRLDAQYWKRRVSNQAVRKIPQPAETTVFRASADNQGICSRPARGIEQAFFHWTRGNTCRRVRSGGFQEFSQPPARILFTAAVSYMYYPQLRACCH